MDYKYSAKLIKVVDGDTIDVKIDLGFKIYAKKRIRLIAIDTPEIHGVKKNSKEYKEGMKAKKFVEKTLKGKEFRLETFKDTTGKYGRYIGDIFIGDENLTNLLLTKGLAKTWK